MLLQMTLFHSFEWLSNTLLYICTISSLSILLVDGCSGCFYVLAVVNSAVMNIGVYVSFQIIFPGVGLLGLMDHNKLENSSRDGNTRPPDLPLEKSVCRSGSNSENWTWNNRLVPNRKRSMSRLYIVTLLI